MRYKYNIIFGFEQNKTFLTLLPFHRSLLYFITYLENSNLTTKTTPFLIPPLIYCSGKFSSINFKINISKRYK